MITALRRRAVLSALALVSLCASAALPSAGVERGPVRHSTTTPVETEARVIVKFKADSALMRALSASGSQSGPKNAQDLSSRLGLVLADGRAVGPRMQVVRGSGLSSQELANRLAAESDVEYAVVDGRMRALSAATPNDPLYGTQTSNVTPAAGQWYLQTPGATLVSAINAEAAWAVTPGKSSVVVADLDTGVRFDHPDLASKLLPGYDFVGGAGTAAALATANDGSGRDGDPSDPGDWITAAETNAVGGQFYGCGDLDANDKPTLKADSSWHGTQTAGIIGAATNNGVGMASVGHDVMVLPLRVLGKCGGYDSDILAAMYYAGGLTNATYTSGLPTNPTPARVINMSLGSAIACSAAYQDAVNQLVAAGVVVVVSAGNQGLNVGSPANCSGVVAVAGVRHSGTKVGYSDLGAAVTISAPAGNCVNPPGQTCVYPILTTSNNGTTTPVATTAGGAKYTSGGNDASLGTSFSAPLVSGTAALMVSANPTLTVAQVVAALKSSARAFPTSAGGVTVAACTAPTSLTDTSTAQGSECSCTTSLCGAGLLDAGAAVSAVVTAKANITATASSVTVGGSVTLDGSQSAASTNRSISTYQWSITSGNSFVALSGATNGPTVTLLGNAVGSAVVSLTVTDSAGVQSTTSATVAATAPPASSGGGAMSLGWLLGWLASVVGVWVVTPRRPQRV
jgi:serine protease